MKIKKLLSKELLMWATIILLGTILFPAPSFASNLYLSPASGNVAVGGNITVQIRLNTGGEAVNGVTAILAYPADKLEATYVSPGSSFGIEAERSFGGGGIRISRGSINPVSGNVHLATIGFRGKTQGVATVSFIGGSAAPRASDSTDSLTGSLGASFTVGGSAPKSTPGSQPSTGPKITEVTLAEEKIRIEKDLNGTLIYYSPASQSATITWKTDTESDSLIEYGLEKDLYFLTQGNASFVNNHKIKLENPILIPGNRIHFRIQSKDGFGNLSNSEDAIIQLKGYPVKIKVVDSNNQSVKGAEVRLYSEALLATTDAQGEAFFENTTAGKHLIVIKFGDTEKTADITIDKTPQLQFFTVSVDLSTVQKIEKTVSRLPAPLKAFVIIMVIAILFLPTFYRRFRQKLS